MTLTISPQAYSRRYRAWLLAMLVAAYACSFVDRIAITVVGQAVIADLRLSDLQFGLLGGMAFALFYSAFGLPIARLAERRSRTGILAASIALWSLMTMLCGVARSYGQLLLYRVGVGIGEGGCTPASHSLISDHYPAGRRASALSIYFLGVPLGSLIGGAAAGWLGERLGWRMMMMVVGAPGLVLALLVWLTLKEPPRGMADRRPAQLNAPPLSALVRRIAVVPSLRHLLAACTITTLAANSISTFAPTFFVRGFGLRLTEAGVIFGAIMGVSGVAGLLAGGFGADAAARRDVRWYAWLPAAGVLTSAPLYAIAYSRSGMEAAAPLILAASLCLSMYSGPCFAMAQNLVEPRMRASVAAVLLLAMNLFGQGLGPTLMGRASDLLAARSFGSSDYLERCVGEQPSSADAAACTAASAVGLRQTLVGMAAFLPIGALHFLLAARTLREDLERMSQSS